jgi:NADH-quinone oxidoreductase subunit C
MTVSDFRTVAADEWVLEHRELRSRGLVFFDLLAVVDLGDQRVEVVTHVMSIDARERAMRRIEVDRGELIPSLVHVFPASAWHEREAHDQNGVEFAGNEDLRVLITDAQPPPLQRNSVLEPRIDKSWPGLYEPGTVAGETRRRRPKPVPGVNEEWLDGVGNDH